jgi:putative transposase
LSNQAESLHRPTRRLERQMQRFKLAQNAKRFLSDHVFIFGYFRPRRHRMAGRNYRTTRALAFKVWTEETYARNMA